MKLEKCKNVGQLIEQLSRLPKSLPIQQGFSKGCVPIVYNDGQSSKELGLKKHLQIRDCDYD